MYKWRVSPISSRGDGVALSTSRRRLREGVTSHDMGCLLPISLLPPPVDVFSPAQLHTLLAGVFAAGCIGREGLVGAVACVHGARA